MLDWIETSRLASTIGQSLLLTGLLSAVHLLGMTLVTGGAVVSGLRFMGVLLRDGPVSAVAAAAGRGITVGLAVSLTSWLLLFSPRASMAVDNSIFQLKMLLLAVAILFHVTHYRRLTKSNETDSFSIRLSGATALVLWIGVALAGSAYILLE